MTDDFPEKMTLRLVSGRFKRIGAILRPGENRSDFCRHAIDLEIARRLKKAIEQEPVIENLRAQGLNLKDARSIAELAFERDEANPTSPAAKGPRRIGSGSAGRSPVARGRRK